MNERIRFNMKIIKAAFFQPVVIWPIIMILFTLGCLAAMIFN